jgi:hypothetical protein
MIDSIDLTNDVTSTVWLALDGIAPGRRGATSVNVTFNGHDPASVALYAHGRMAGPLAQHLRLMIFESTAALLPFPVFTGSLADFTGHTSYHEAVGRWTGRGDGKDHTVTYEVAWSLPKDAEAPDDEPKVGLVFEARSSAE